MLFRHFIFFFLILFIFAFQVGTCFLSSCPFNICFGVSLFFPFFSLPYALPPPPPHPPSPPSLHFFLLRTCVSRQIIQLSVLCLRFLLRVMMAPRWFDWQPCRFLGVTCASCWRKWAAWPCTCLVRSTRNTLWWSWNRHCMASPTSPACCEHCRTSSSWRAVLAASLWSCPTSSATETVRRLHGWMSQPCSSPLFPSSVCAQLALPLAPSSVCVYNQPCPLLLSPSSVRTQPAGLNIIAIQGWKFTRAKKKKKWGRNYFNDKTMKGCWRLILLEYLKENDPLERFEIFRLILALAGTILEPAKKKISTTVVSLRSKISATFCWCFSELHHLWHPFPLSCCIQCVYSAELYLWFGCICF